MGDIDSVSAGGWKRSSKCASGACVEVRMASKVVLLRDSSFPAHDVLSFGHAEWAGLVAQLRGTGSETGAPATVEPTPEGVNVRRQRGGVKLSFSRREWDAFLAGVRAGEFDL